MACSMRERWLFPMLRSARPLSPTGVCKYYRPQTEIKIRTHEGQFTILPSDQMDVSDVEFIRVVREGFGILLPWASVTSVQIRQPFHSSFPPGCPGIEQEIVPQEALPGGPGQGTEKGIVPPFDSLARSSCREGLGGAPLPRTGLKQPTAS